MRKKTVRVPKPIRSPQVPVTAQMLNDMEGRLDHKISSVREELRAEIHGVKAELHGVKAEIHGLKSDIHDVKSELHRMSLMMEEQKAQNVYVLDGYAQLYALIEKKLG